MSSKKEVSELKGSVLEALEALIDNLEGTPELNLDSWGISLDMAYDAIAKEKAKTSCNHLDQQDE